MSNIKLLFTARDIERCLSCSVGKHLPRMRETRSLPLIKATLPAGEHSLFGLKRVLGDRQIGCLATTLSTLALGNSPLMQHQ